MMYAAASRTFSLNEDILRVALGIDWCNYRHALSKRERRRRASQVRETIALIRQECSAEFERRDWQAAA